MPATKSAAKTVVRTEKQQLTSRINRIAGQVNGIAKMIEQDRYCVDILNQLSAIHSALDALGLQLLEHHTQGCVQEAIRKGKGEAAIQELMQVVKKFTR